MVDEETTHDRRHASRAGNGRRTAPRWSITVDANVYLGTDEIPSRVVSISSSGLLVRTGAMVPVGARIRVVLDDPRVTDGIALEGVVVRSVGTSAGVALIGVDAATMAVVRRLVSRTGANGIISG